LKIAFITNICPHYRIRTFEVLSKKLPIEFFFFSAGKEWYWQRQHGVFSGDFNFQYLSGFSIGQTRISLGLPWKLLFNPYQAYIKCINGKFALPVTYLIARLKGKPFILWTGIWVKLQTFTHQLVFPLTRYIYQHSDAIVVYGDHVKRYLISEGVNPEKIFIAHHAVDNEFYNRMVSEDAKEILRKSLGIDGSNQVVLYLGRLEQNKGLRYLIEGFNKIKDNNKAVLVIAGRGDHELFLKELAKKLRIEKRVVFPGYVKISDAVKYYSIGTTLVLPSVSMPTGKETWGLVVNEAFNQGLPVIATDAVGAATGGLVENGVNGFIIPERDSDALARALVDLLDDAPLRTKMSENALSKITTWNNEKMVQGFYDAVEYVLPQR
jgi:glycosyltransferase involved in cell wall biosynthesis